MSEKTELEVFSHSEAETEALGRAIGLAGRGGELVGLVGELGAGKTRLVKGIALGLGLKAGQVRSPTFVLIREHQGRLRLYHVDAYRLENSGQLENLGFDEIAAGDGLVVVEWADRVWELIKQYEPMEIHLEHASETQRTIRLEHLPKEMQQQLNLHF